MRHRHILMVLLPFELTTAAWTKVASNVNMDGWDVSVQCDVSDGDVRIGGLH